MICIKVWDNEGPLSKKAKLMVETTIDGRFMLVFLSLLSGIIHRQYTQEDIDEMGDDLELWDKWAKDERFRNNYRVIEGGKSD